MIVEPRVYGPYKRKDGRQHVILIYANGVRRTVSYPKWLVELRLGRNLNPNTETIDHIDGDFNNNDFNNLRIITRSEHVKDDHTYRVRSYALRCCWCGKDFVSDTKGRGRKTSGPFCSRTCSGKYGAEIQNERFLPINGNNLPRAAYYKRKKDGSSMGKPIGSQSLNSVNAEMPTPSQASQEEGVETQQRPPKDGVYGEDRVQTTNREGSENYSSM